MMPKDRADQRTKFFDQYRSYVIHYNLGRDLVRAYVERQATDDLVGEAMASVSSHPDVERAHAEATVALEALLAAAKPEGLRGDATVRDLRLLFAWTRAANEMEPGARERVFELWLDAAFERGTPS